jgi:hypothetical protein
MERVQQLTTKLEDKALKAFGIEAVRTGKSEQRIEAMADFIERADPQESIRVQCSTEEVDEVMEGITRGLARIQSKKEQEEQE